MNKPLPWIGILTIIWVIVGTIYVSVQQAQRSAANMPQIQIAEDAASSLNAGKKAGSFDGQKVNIAFSLAPFTIIYDKQGNPVAGTGYLNGKLADAPLGILQASNGNEYHAVTWQPQNNVRIAAVTTSSSKYFVLSGRNIKEVEKNERLTAEIAALGGLAATLMLAAAYGINHFMYRK